MLAITFEVLSALITGVLLDYDNMSAEKISWIYAAVGFAIFFAWFILHVIGRLGVPQGKPSQKEKIQDQDIKDNNVKPKTEKSPLLHP